MNTVSLEMDGAVVCMEGIRQDASEGTVSWTFSTRFPNVPDAKVPNRLCKISSADLKRLVMYMQAHIGPNAPHRIEDSASFVTYELDFQVQAFSGELGSWEDGYFTLQWSFYCGPNDRSHDAVYIGFEAPVQVPEVLRWCRELEMVLNA